MPIDRPSGGDSPEPPERPREPADRGRGLGHIDEEKISDEKLASFLGIDLDDDDPEPIELSPKDVAADQARIADRTPEGEGFQRITRGVWYSSEPGWGDIDSGARDKGQPDELALKAGELLKERTGIMQRLRVAGDVEMKLAARMVRDDIQFMTAVINNQVCEGPYSCDALVERVLPVGSKLRVYQGDGTMRLFEGKYEGQA